MRAPSGEARFCPMCGYTVMFHAHDFGPFLNEAVDKLFGQHIDEHVRDFRIELELRF